MEPRRGRPDSNRVICIGIYEDMQENGLRDDNGAVGPVQLKAHLYRLQLEYHEVET